MSDDRTFLVEADRRIATTRRWLDVATAIAAGTQQRRAIAAARNGFAEWVAAMRLELATYRAGRRAEAIAVSLGANRTLRKRYEAAPRTLPDAGRSSGPFGRLLGGLRFSTIDRDPDRLPLGACRRSVHGYWLVP